MAVQTITYEDKSYLNQNADIPATNKVQDTDMNEIKSVVNNNASETSSNTTNISNITGQVLWTNPNPTSDFSAQTITLSSSDYDLLEVFYKKTKDDMFVNNTRFFKGTRSLLFQIDNSFVIFERTISDATDTTLTFTEGKIYTTQGTVTTQNSRCIPLYIVGYKMGLFN